MKKILITLTTTLITAAAFGQGSVNFANAGSTAVTNSLTMARVASGNTFNVSLYFLPDMPGITPTSEMFDAGMILATTNFSLGGIFGYGAVIVPAPLITPPGGFGWFQVRVWEVAFGSTYAQAAIAPAMGGRQALIGTSNILRIDTGDPTSTPAQTPTTLIAAGLKGFFVTPVPEPSTLALGALGLSALLFLRRRK